MNKPCIRYEDMTDRKLKSILRRSLTDDTFSADDLFIIADILKQRDAGKGKDPPDAEAAWDRFVTEKLCPVSDSPSAAPAKFSIRRQNRIYQRCAVFVIFSITVFSVLFTAQALGMDIIGTIVRWTADIFHYEYVDRDTKEFEGTRLEDFDFSDGELPGEFIPGWMPLGFREVNSKYFSETGLESILVEYADENNSLVSIVLTKYGSAISLSSDYFEKQAPDVETLVCNNKVFAAAGNGESNFWTAAWSEGPLVFQIEGNISKSDLIKILNSLGGSL